VPLLGLALGFPFYSPLHQAINPNSTHFDNYSTRGNVDHIRCRGDELAPLLKQGARRAESLGGRYLPVSLIAAAFYGVRQCSIL
jgi:hypothetical protein